jgi:ABC-type nitrate/sulfonate/bicarbonate transport system permease component
MLQQKLRPSTRALCMALGIATMLALWELAVAQGLVSSLLLPRPLAVAQTLVAMVQTPSFWRDLGATVGTWLLGVAVGTAIGGILGLLLGLNPYVWAAVEPWVEFFRALPSIVLVPLVSIFMGVGTGSRLTCATLVVVLLMLSSAATALRSTRSSYLRLGVAWRATPIQMLSAFYVPATLSHLIVALRAAIPLALIVTVAADMLIATDTGIGRILMDSLAIFDTKKLYAGVLVVGTLGYAAASLSAFLERKTIHWSGT